MTISFLLLSPLLPIASLQGLYFEKDITFRSSDIYRKVEKAIYGNLEIPKEDKVEFDAEPFNVYFSMKF